MICLTSSLEIGPSPTLVYNRITRKRAWLMLLWGWHNAAVTLLVKPKESREVFLLRVFNRCKYHTLIQFFNRYAHVSARLLLMSSFWGLKIHISFGQDYISISCLELKFDCLFLWRCDTDSKCILIWQVVLQLERKFVGFLSNEWVPL